MFEGAADLGARAADASDRAVAFAARTGELPAQDLLRLAIQREFPGKIAVVSSFGAEAAVILALVAEIERTTPVIFLETDKHFPETLAYRDLLSRRLGLTDVRSIKPDRHSVDSADPDGELWGRAPDDCCHLRKVVPLERALAGFESWITGRKRFHGGERIELQRVEAVNGRVKLNPLADWRQEQVAAAFRRYDLPPHPLTLRGYGSIGCAPCTHRSVDGESLRSGRWAWTDKTECGIHRARWAQG
jgi:phosphoadenosine phosphosulfate reductase